MFVLEFHRGRLSKEDAGRDGALRAAGVGVFATEDGAGDGATSFGMADFFAVRVVGGCASPEYLRTLERVDRAAELTELPRRLELPRGVVAPLRAFPGVMTTDEAGELPGVSTTLPVAGLSMVTIVDIESRSC